MSCGIPSAVTDVGDSAYFVADSGIVAPPHGPEALGNGIGRLIEIGNSGRQQLGVKARQRIETEFSPQASARRYEDLYLRPKLFAEITILPNTLKCRLRRCT
jgi:glycosyltransferase involved in cell wall biosynthesis